MSKKSSGPGYKLNWKGEEVKKIIGTMMENIVSDLGHAAAGNAMKELTKGHGVVTATLQRSIHAAPPGYGWNSDVGSGFNVGGKKIVAIRRGSRVSVEVGSGLEYAMAIHQGWNNSNGLRGTFEGYHFLTIGVEKTRAQVPVIIRRNVIKYIGG